MQQRLNYPDPCVYPEQYELAGMVLPEDQRSRVEDFAPLGLSPFLQEIGIPKGAYLGNIFSELAGNERFCDWPILRQLPRSLSAFVPCLEDEVPILARHFLLQGRRVEIISLHKKMKWDGIEVPTWRFNIFDLIRGENGEALVDLCGAVCKGWMGRCAGRKGLIVNRHGADMSERLAYKLRALSLFVVERERDRTGNPLCPSPSDAVLPNLLKWDAETIHRLVRSAPLRLADPKTRQFIRDEFPALPRNRKLRKDALRELQEEITLLRAACVWLREFNRKRLDNGVPLVTNEHERIRIAEMRTCATSTVVLVPLPACDFEQPSWLNGALNVLFTYVRGILQNTAGRQWVWFVVDEALGGFNNLPAVMMEKSPTRNGMGVVAALHTERLLTLQYPEQLAKHVFWGSGLFGWTEDGIGGMFADEIMYRSGKTSFKTAGQSLSLREWFILSGVNISEGETLDWVWFPQSSQSAFRRFWYNRDIYNVVHGVQVGIYVLPYVIQGAYIEDPGEALADGQIALLLTRQKQKQGPLTDMDVWSVAPGLRLSVGAIPRPTPEARKAMEAAAHRVRAGFPMLGERGPLPQELAAAQKTEKWAFWIALPILAAVGVAAKLLHLW